MSDCIEDNENDALRPVGPEILVAAILSMAEMRAALEPRLSRQDAIGIGMRLHAKLLGIG